jgi:hypothetical protein
MEQDIEQTPKDVEETNPEGTQTTETTEQNPIDHTQEAIDYKKKFSESSSEALRLFEENKRKDEEIERLRKLSEGASHSNNSEELYPGFGNLEKEEQERLVRYTEGIRKSAVADIYKDPAISHAKSIYNKSKWEEAFQSVVSQYPEIKQNEDEFRKKYYRPDNVPENIGELMPDLAKIHLFDKAKDLGAKEAEERNNRMDIERAGGGDKTPKHTSRSLEDWNRLAQTNPAKFAKLSKEFKADMDSGKLK